MGSSLVGAYIPTSPEGKAGPMWNQCQNYGRQFPSAHKTTTNWWYFQLISVDELEGQLKSGGCDLGPMYSLSVSFSTGSRVAGARRIAVPCDCDGGIVTLPRLRFAPHCSSSAVVFGGYGSDGTSSAVYVASTSCRHRRCAMMVKMDRVVKPLWHFGQLQPKLPPAVRLSFFS